MKILIEQCINADDNLIEEMYLNKNFILSAYPLCNDSESATLERGMISCSKVAELMQLAYNAGVDGEKFKIKYRQVDYIGED